MRIKESVLRTVRCAYAYNNNGAVSFAFIHEERHGKANVKVEWASIHGSDIKAQFTGRIVIHRRGALRIALSAIAIKAKGETIDGGSPNSKAKGVAVGYINFQLGPETYIDDFHVNLLEGFLSTDFTYQPDSKDTLEPAEERYSWAGYQIA